LFQFKEVVECRHQRNKKDGGDRLKKKSELGGGYPGEGRAAELDPAVQEKMYWNYLQNLCGAELWIAAP
jgi:hypothetical protein